MSFWQDLLGVKRKEEKSKSSQTGLHLYLGLVQNISMTPKS